MKARTDDSKIEPQATIPSAEVKVDISTSGLNTYIKINENFALYNESETLKILNLPESFKWLPQPIVSLESKSYCEFQKKFKDLPSQLKESLKKWNSTRHLLFQRIGLFQTREAGWSTMSVTHIPFFEALGGFLGQERESYPGVHSVTCYRNGEVCYIDASNSGSIMRFAMHLSRKSSFYGTEFWVDIDNIATENVVGFNLQEDLGLPSSAIKVEEGINSGAPISVKNFSRVFYFASGFINPFEPMGYDYLPSGIPFYLFSKTGKVRDLVVIGTEDDKIKRVRPDPSADLVLTGRTTSEAISGIIALGKFGVTQELPTPIASKEASSPGHP